MFLIWTRAWVFFASSVRPISLGTTRAASRPRMTMTTMISMRVNPDRSRSLVYRLANSLKHRERRCAAPARRASEGVPGEYGELAERSWSGCSGARMPRYLRDGALVPLVSDHIGFLLSEDL